MRTETKAPTEDILQPEQNRIQRQKASGLVDWLTDAVTRWLIDGLAAGRCPLGLGCWPLLDMDTGTGTGMTMTMTMMLQILDCRESTLIFNLVFSFESSLVWVWVWVWVWLSLFWAGVGARARQSINQGLSVRPAVYLRICICIRTGICICGCRLPS